ncbi:hypothetical protein BGZ89_012018 [Linnemannia elongata]|nr:hypothetical protein BGZ89_012018 [Linnemannia elongata]
MLFKHFTLTFVALAASVNVLAIPIHPRRADNLASTTGNNGAPVAENNAPKIALPPQSPPPPVPRAVTPAPASTPAALTNTDSSSQLSKATSNPTEPAANNAQMITPTGDAADKLTTGNSQTVKSATDTPAGDNTVQTINPATGTPEPNDVQGVSPTKDASTTPAVNNGQSSSPVADTPEANNAQPTTPNKDATNTANNPVAQTAKDSPAVNNNNKPTPMATTPDAPSPNDIHPQSQSDSPTRTPAQPQSLDTNASEPTDSQTTPPIGPAAQAVSEPEDASHPMAAPAFTSTTETQAAPKSDVANTPAPEPMTAKQIQPASEPKIASPAQSTEETTDHVSHSQSASVEAVNPNPQPAPAKEENPEPQPAAVKEVKSNTQPLPANDAKQEPEPAPAAEAKPETQTAATKEANPDAKPAAANVVKPELKPTSAEESMPETKPAPVVETKPDPQSILGKEEKSEPKPAPAEEPKPETKPAPVPEPQSTPGNEENSERPAPAPALKAKPEPQPAPAAEAKPKPAPAPAKDLKQEPLPAPVDETKPVHQPASVTQPNATPGAPAVPAPSIECLALLMKTQQPLTEACHKLIRGDPTLIQLAGLGSVELDFMYSGKDFPVISSDGLRLKLQEIPGYTLSVIEARYDVKINYKNHDTVSFSPPWAPSTMQGSTVITAIDQVDVNVLSSNAFTDLIAAMLTKPETLVILEGTVDINLSIASTDGGAPKSIIIAGLQFSSPGHMPGLSGLAKKSFVHSDGYEVYGDTFYFTSVFEFMNPSNLKLTLGGVKFDVIDSTGKQLATSAVDVFEIAPKENEVSLRLISKVDESAAFLNRLHYTGDTVTIQGKTGSSNNPFLDGALSQLRFTVTYPAIADVPAQSDPVTVDTPLPVPNPVANIPPKRPFATTPGLL